MIRGVIKFITFFSCVVCFLVQHTLIELLIRNEEKRLRFILGSLKIWCRIALFVLRVKVEAETPSQGKFLVANHISYVDVLVLFSRYPSLFVTSTEIRDTFLLGRITRLAGCFFVERRKNLRTEATLELELSQMKRKFQAGFSVFIFPEGTSSRGDNLLPFKASYFQLALDGDIAITPLLLVYESREVVPWIGKMTFPDHLFRLCCEKEIRVKLVEVPTVRPLGDRFELAKVIHQKMSEAYAQH